MDKQFKVLVILSFISFLLYLIEISDIILMYEIFISILLTFTLLGGAGLLLIVIIDIIRFKIWPKKMAMYIFFLLIVLPFILIYAKRNGVFSGPEYLQATFIGERERMDLTLYKNGNYTIFHNWLFGEVRLEGTYYQRGDTITFYNWFVEDIISKKQVVIDNSKNKIFFDQDSTGKYDESYYYFEIH